WAETSTIGKLSFARSTASDADIKKRSNTLFREAIEQYSGQYRNAEKAIEKAVSERNDAQKKAISAERQNSHLVSRNAELESKIITADDALSRIDAALAENVMNLHEEASESGLETDYQKLSGACLAVVDISKVQKLELALLQVSSVVKDVSRRVPEMFKKTFSWAIEKVYRHHSMASPGPEGP
ncbi:hypothetical protein, partial [Acetobacter sp. P1H12_c]|uniref:hypothetical protein n=1 Tax=Acetobacter sp. P1H12_c TaxID=2762621 RepID=UPI001C05582B